MRRFRDFMAEKVVSYYSSPREKFSSKGDFFTAPELDRVFGETIGSFLYPYLREFESPALLELGAGRGLMARDILRYIRLKDEELFGRLTYFIYEASSYLVEKQADVLRDFENVKWVDTLPDMEGVVLSNEFFDALPVHVIKGTKELYVDDEGREVWMDLKDERIEGFLRRMGYLGMDQRVEVCIDCIDFLRRIARSLKRGYHLVIDYGYTSEDISRFPEGTVVGYKKHRVKSDIYGVEGLDISAHVNFSALIEFGKDFGLKTVFFKSQRDFLMEQPHFVSELQALSSEESPEAIERLSRLKIMLISMGDRFKVLFQSKGL